MNYCNSFTKDVLCVCRGKIYRYTSVMPWTMFMWRFKLPFCADLYEQVGQLKGFSPVWMRMWISRSFGQGNCFRQTLQTFRSFCCKLGAMPVMMDGNNAELVSGEPDDDALEKVRDGGRALWFLSEKLNSQAKSSIVATTSSADEEAAWVDELLPGLEMVPLFSSWNKINDIELLVGRREQKTARVFAFEELVLSFIRFWKQNSFTCCFVVFSFYQFFWIGIIRRYSFEKYNNFTWVLRSRCIKLVFVFDIRISSASRDTLYI